MVEPFTLKLSQPARSGERSVSELTFAEPKVKHILATDRHRPDSIGADVALVASLTGEPELVIQGICPTDWRKIRRHIAGVWREFLVDDPTESDPKSTDRKKGGQASDQTSE